MKKPKASTVVTSIITTSLAVTSVYLYKQNKMLKNRLDNLDLFITELGSELYIIDAAIRTGNNKIIEGNKLIADMITSHKGIKR